jgi:hypothetical protein
VPELPALTVADLCREAGEFAEIESAYDEPSLYGVDNGKSIGTYVEHKFREFLAEKYEFQVGSSASGIDFPGLNVDMKVTRITQPQSSCPYKNARQKIYGLGYSVLVFVYDKTDDRENRTANLNIVHTIFVEKEQTADFQTTTGLRRILDNDGNKDDVLAFIYERNLPVEDIGASRLADEILESPPEIGYLTISNALQWRLQYDRAIDKAGEVDGIQRIR